MINFLRISINNLNCSVFTLFKKEKNHYSNNTFCGFLHFVRDVLVRKLSSTNFNLIFFTFSGRRSSSQRVHQRSNRQPNSAGRQINKLQLIEKGSEFKVDLFNCKEELKVLKQTTITNSLIIMNYEQKNYYLCIKFFIKLAKCNKQSQDTVPNVSLLKPSLIVFLIQNHFEHFNRWRQSFCPTCIASSWSERSTASGPELEPSRSSPPW